MPLPPGVTQEDVDAALARERALAEERRRSIQELYTPPPAEMVPQGPMYYDPAAEDMQRRVAEERKRQLEMQIKQRQLEEERRAVEGYKNRNPAAGKTLPEMYPGWKKNAR